MAAIKAARDRVRGTLYFVIPVLDEAENMPRLFAGLAAAAASAGDRDVAVCLVDDGSTDGTADVARAHADSLPLTVLRHERNRGPGSAFGTAFEYLSGSLADGDLVLTLEGDNTSRVDLVAAMLRRIDEGHDAVFASPYMYGGGLLHTPPLRVLMSHIANLLVKEMLGVRGILTVSSFFRLYRASTIRRLQAVYGPRIVERSGFESMVELVMKMVYIGQTISEIPMVLDTAQRAGASKLNVRRTALGYVALAFRKRRWGELARASAVRDRGVA